MLRVLFLLILLVVAGLVAGCSRPEPQSEPKPAASPPSTHQPTTAGQPAVPRVPPYHATAEAARPFPALMPASRYRDYPVVARAYEVAHRIPGVLAQQPCYCYCDKFGHGSLLDCYASDHGAT